MEISDPSIAWRCGLLTAYEETEQRASSVELGWELPWRGLDSQLKKAVEVKEVGSREFALGFSEHDRTSQLTVPGRNVPIENQGALFLSQLRIYLRGDYDLPRPQTIHAPSIDDIVRFAINLYETRQVTQLHHPGTLPNCVELPRYAKRSNFDHRRVVYRESRTTRNNREISIESRRGYSRLGQGGLHYENTEDEQPEQRERDVFHEHAKVPFSPAILSSALRY
jgi:hypothetical protein